MSVLKQITSKSLRVTRKSVQFQWIHSTLAALRASLPGSGQLSVEVRVYVSNSTVETPSPMFHLETGRVVRKVVDLLTTDEDSASSISTASENDAIGHLFSPTALGNTFSTEAASEEDALSIESTRYSYISITTFSERADISSVLEAEILSVDPEESIGIAGLFCSVLSLCFSVR